MTRATVLTCLVVISAAAADAAPDRASCQQLASALTLHRATVTAAGAVDAGSFMPPSASGEGAPRAITNLPAFCRVQLTLTPSSDSDIKAEVWMPLAGWNGKFQEVGNGAFAGSIQYGALGEAVRRGYAAASTDAGHTVADASFALGHPEKLIDFGYRAVHETAVQAKTTITSFYQAPPRLSYFNGCSGGGRMAFQELQMFPEDFDAILAGAPAWDRVNESLAYLYKWTATHERPESMIPPEKYPVLHRAALAACDALDGLKDGLIGNPLACHFNPKVTQCTNGDGPDCLTAPQVDAAAKIYEGVKHPKTGALIFAGLEPGSELSWKAASAGPEASTVGTDVLKYMLFQDAHYDYRTFDLARDWDRVHALDSQALSPSNADISPFVARGGKLLIYHGWADQNVAPRSSVDYYNRLLATTGRQKVDAAVRMFMAPGMAHCSGGEGPNVFDALSALEQWREKGVAPTSILATHSTNGVVDRSRPLCPYPQIAKYRGTGSIDQAENFVCATP